jgi:hypothetical protein
MGRKKKFFSDNKTDETKITTEDKPKEKPAKEEPKADDDKLKNIPRKYHKFY